MPDNSQPGGVRHVLIEENRAGQRLDNFLLGQFKGAPRSLIYRLLRTGQVRVNGARAKPEYRLQAADDVRLPPVPRDGAARSTVPAGLIEQLSEAVIYEDDELLVLNKPAGIAVHAGSGTRHGIIETLRARGGHWQALELVHRLDRDTSGCLLLAKQRQTLLALNAELQAGGFEKEYQVLVKGSWAQPATVALSLSRSGSRYRDAFVDTSGKHATSRFEPMRLFETASLMRVRLETGRTHQIRVHGAELGHPVAGDRRYGDFAFNRELRRLGLKRMFLHAARLGIGHAGGLTFTAELPVDLQRVLARLAERDGVHGAADGE